MTSESRLVPPSTWPLSVTCTFFYSTMYTVFFPNLEIVGNTLLSISLSDHNFLPSHSYPVLILWSLLFYTVEHSTVLNSSASHFLAALLWPQSFPLYSLDSRFYHFKCFRYLISPPLVSSFNSSSQAQGSIIASPLLTPVPYFLHQLLHATLCMSSDFLRVNNKPLSHLCLPL